MKIGHIPERLEPVLGPRYQPIKNRDNPFPAGAHPSGSPQTRRKGGQGIPQCPIKGVHERISAPLRHRDRSSCDDFPGKGEKRLAGAGLGLRVLVWHVPASWILVWHVWVAAACPRIACARVPRPGGVSHYRMSQDCTSWPSMC